MKVVLLDIPGSVERAPHRYKSWRDVFGSENFGIVYPSNIEREISSGEKATINFLNDDLSLRSVSNYGVASDLFLAREFVDSFGSLPDSDRIDKIMSYVERESEKGNIGSVVNSRKGTLNQKDKLSDIALSKSVPVRMASNYHFSNYDDFKDFIASRDSSYVVKHRFGADGFDIRRVNKDNVRDFDGVNFENYVVQDELDIDYETRVVMLDGEVLGARKIIDRTRPWETGEVERSHVTSVYTPTDYEVDFTRKIMKHSDLRLGCVDWVGVKESDDLYYLETNGVATGYGGYAGAPYDLNKVVALKLKENK